VEGRKKGSKERSHWKEGRIEGRQAGRKEEFSNEIGACQIQKKNELLVSEKIRK
jgi:hypothetical protein